MSVQRKFTAAATTAQTMGAKAVITTAIPLDDETQNVLTAELDRRLGLAAWRFEVDPDLIGGIRVRLGDQVYDGTAARWFQYAERDLLSEGLRKQADPAEFAAMAIERLKALENRIIVEEVGTVLAVGDGVVQIGGLHDAMLGELVQFSRENVMGMVMNLEEDTIGCVLLGDERRVEEGDEVRLTGRVVEVPVGRTLIGRVVDALGQPLDDHGPIASNRTRPISSMAPGIAERQPVMYRFRPALKWSTP